MIKILSDNLGSIDPLHGLSGREIEEEGGRIKDLSEKIESRGVGFYKRLDDKSLIESINGFAASRKGKYKDIVVMGIGGSALGTICLQQSLTHLFKPSGLHIIDNIDPTLIRELEDVIDISKTLFIAVTKSGSTPETLAQFFYFKDKCEKMYRPVHDQFVIITDPEKGLLRKIASTENIPAFEVPPDIGGRFSVLTAVGLLPASLIGINIEKLLAGANSMKGSFLNPDPEQNLPFRIAVMQYLLLKKGKNINVITPYAQKLIRFADWYRQLLAESIGKKTDNRNQTVNTGITPVNALGATDQHSQSQLYNEGPNDKFHIFIRVNNLGHRMDIPNLYPDEESVKFLTGLSFNKLLATEMEGTIQSLTQNDRPNITIEIEKIDEEALGEMFMLFEGATAFLGELLNIDAFDQPGVELSKQITKKLLLQNE